MIFSPKYHPNPIEIGPLNSVGRLRFSPWRPCTQRTLGPQDGQAPQGYQKNEVLVVPPYMTTKEIRADFLTIA